jgi:hypothetical protein
VNDLAVDVNSSTYSPAASPIRIPVPARIANSGRYWPCAASMIRFN